MSSPKHRERRYSRWIGGIAATAAIAPTATLAVVAPPAIASPPNPWATATITHVFDGTGHGIPGMEPFVNTTTQGFAFGDDGPQDGYVSSHDIVRYAVEVRFMGGAARTVAVSLDFGLAPWLEWSTVADQFCTNGRHIRATRQGPNTCLFQVPAGVVESFTVPLDLTARDTGGHVQRDQLVRITTGLPGQPPHSVSSADKAVHVVSAPSADVILTQPNNIIFNSATGQIEARDSFTWSTGNPTGGQFRAIVRPLQFVGYHPYRGVSTTGEWFGYLDVSSFPDDTEWRVGGSAAPVQLADANGRITLPPASGDVTILFTLPGGWPYQNPGTAIFPARVIVDPASFSTSPVMLNNGTGWQPGDGQSQTYNTFDPDTGAIRGAPFNNNDYSAARVTRPRPWTPPDDYYYYRNEKSIFGPWDPSRTLWEDENRLWDGNPIGPRQWWGAGPRNAAYVASGTQLEMELRAWTNTRMPASVNRMIIGDGWTSEHFYLDVNRDGFDPAAPFRVRQGTTPFAPGDFVAQWHEERRESHQITDPADPGWTTTMPADPQSFRIIFEPDVVTFRGGFTAGQVFVELPFTVRDNIDHLAGLNLDNVMGTAWLTRDLTMPGHNTLRQSSAFVRLRAEVPAEVDVTNVITHVQGAPTSDPIPTAIPGSTISHWVRPYVANLPSTSAPVTPTVTIQLDNCANTPVNLSGWNMQVIPAVPSSPGARICGDPLATGIQLVFTPTGPGSTMPVTWTDRSVGEGHLGDIRFSVDISSVVSIHDTFANVAHFEIAEAIPTASAPAQVNLDLRDETAGLIRATPARTEILQPLTWMVDIWNMETAVGSGRAEAVIIFPRNEIDHEFYNPQHTLAGWTGPDRSRFHGGFTMVDAHFDLEHTSDDVVLWFTTDPTVTFDPNSAVWHRMDDPAFVHLQPQATALRVEIDFEDESTAARIVNITLQPYGNLPDDQYVMWLSPVFVDGNTTYPATYQPPPAHIDVVASKLSGLVWWDTDADGLWQIGEHGIPNVRVTLHRANADGTAGAQIAYTYTDVDGRYEFIHLVAGTYVVVVHRGAGTPIADQVNTFFSQWLDIYGTYVARSLFGNLARNRGAVQVPSTPISLMIDSEQRNIAFGFHQPDPMIALDKTNARFADADCPDPSVGCVPECPDGVCELYWDVIVTNRGETPLSDVVIHDRMSSDMFNTWAQGMIAVRAVDVSQRNRHTLALMDDGTVVGWGLNTNGRAGCGAAHNWYPYPCTVEGIENAVAVATGWSHSLVITEEGTVLGFGADGFGQLGRGSTAASRFAPARVLGVGGVGYLGEDDPIVNVAAGEAFSLAVSEAGYVFAFGWTQHGRLGNGVQASGAQSTPVQIMHSDGTPLSDIVQVSSGHSHSLALTRDGDVWAWGGNERMQLGTQGIPSSMNAVHPVRVYMAATGSDLLSGIVQVETSSGLAGNNERSGVSYAVHSSGRVFSWGSNIGGGLGDNTAITAFASSTIRPHPDYVLNHEGTAPMENIASIAAGHGLLGAGESSVLFLLTNSGEVYAFGVSGLPGQALGFGVLDRRSGVVSRPRGTPTPISAPLDIARQDPYARLEGVTAIAPRVAIVAGGVYSWGNQWGGDLGQGHEGQPLSGNSRIAPGPVVSVGHTAPPLSGVVYAAGSETMTYVITRGGAVLGMGQHHGPAGVELMGLGLGTTITGWEGQQSTIRPNGSVDGPSFSPVPQHVAGRDGVGQLRNIVQIDIAPLPNNAIDHTLALSSDGHVYAWGNGSNGQLGQGNTAHGSVPQRVLGPTGGSDYLENIVQISAGHQMSLALDVDGRVWGWGNTRSTIGQVTRPVQLLDNNSDLIIGATYIHAAMQSAFVVNANGNVLAWGQSSGGHLGQGSQTVAATQTTPILVSGVGGFGFLGDDHEIVQIDTAGGPNITTSRAVYARTADGEILVWGGIAAEHVDGRTGTNLNTPAYALTANGPLTDVVQFAVGAPGVTSTAAGAGNAWGAPAVAVLGDGRVFMWGWQRPGCQAFIPNPAGTGNPLWARDPGCATVTPVAVEVDMVDFAGPAFADGIKHVAAGAGHLVFVAYDGSTAVWGRNSQGMLGLGQSGGNNASSSRWDEPYTMIDTRNMPQLGRSLRPGMPLTPNTYDRTSNPGWLEQTFNLPGTLAPGEQRVIRIGGSVLQNQDVLYVPGETAAFDGRQVMVNQAWVNSPLTPFNRVPDFTHPDCLTATDEFGNPVRVNCPPHLQDSPPNPIPPLPDLVDPDGIPGNWICDTDSPEEWIWTGPQYPGNSAGWQMWREDLCDQVPVVVPPRPAMPLGDLAGYVWIDLSRDHLRGDYDGTAEPRLEGVYVYLFRRNLAGDLVPVPRPRQVTDVNGWFEFTGLIPGEYEVRFILPIPVDAQGDPDPERGWGFVNRHVGSGGPCHSVGDGVRIGAGNACIDSDAIQSGDDIGLSGLVTVVANQRAYADAGVVINRPAISVVKTSPIGEDRVFTLPEDAALDRLLECSDPSDASTCIYLDSIPVTFTIQNVGNETLGDFLVTDTTLLGPDVVWDSCDAVVPAPSDWIVPTAEIIALNGEGEGENGPTPPAAVRIFASVFDDDFELATGESITCRGRLLLLGNDGESLVAVDDIHLDRIDVQSRGIHTRINADGDDDWQIEVTTIPEIDLPPTGGLGSGDFAAWVILAGLAAVTVLAAHRVQSTKKPREVATD